MNVIVVGIGKVGYTVAEQLVAEDHDVTVIDTNEIVLSDTIEELDVRGVHGNGASRKVKKNLSFGTRLRSSKCSRLRFISEQVSDAKTAFKKL